MMAITHGHLLACPCGGGKPDQGFYAPPETHYTSCAKCGEFFADDTADMVAAVWNGAARAKLARAVA
jgi:hypothetical protein